MEGCKSEGEKEEFCFSELDDESLVASFYFSHYFNLAFNMASSSAEKEPIQLLDF